MYQLPEYRTIKFEHQQRIDRAAAKPVRTADGQRALGRLFASRARPKRDGLRHGGLGLALRRIAHS